MKQVLNCANEINIKTLRQEIVAIDPAAEVWILSDRAILIKHKAEHDFSEIVQNHDGAAENLKDAKEQKILKIDEKTSELILAGALHENLIFSMSASAQINWQKLESDNDAGRMEFPYTIRSKDDQYFQFADSAAANSFFKSIADHKLNHLGSGWLLVDQVKSKETIAEVEAVLDDR